MRIRHVLLTRFNMPTPGREAKLRSDPGWLARRFDLFERYCLPTIAAQDAQDFGWIVYFDEATPAPFRDRIERLRGIREFHPYYTHLFGPSGWRDSVLE